MSPEDADQSKVRKSFLINMGNSKNAIDGKNKMYRATRKKELQLPRKRLIEEAPALKKGKKLNSSLSMTSFLFIILSIFVALSIYSELELNSGTVSRTINLNVFPKLSAQNMMGQVGSFLAFYLLNLFGYCSFIVVMLLILIGKVFSSNSYQESEKKFAFFLRVLVFSLIFVLSSATLAAVFYGFTGGGIVGSKFALKLIVYFNETGTVLLVGTALLVALSFLSSFHPAKILSVFKKILPTFGSLNSGATNVSMKIIELFYANLKAMLKFFIPGLKYSEAKNQVFLDDSPSRPKDIPFTLGMDPEDITQTRVFTLPEFEAENDLDLPKLSKADLEKSKKEIIISRKERTITSAKEAKEKLEKLKKKLRGKAKESEEVHRDFQMPSLDFLVKAESNTKAMPNDQELIANSRRLEQTLLNFKIGGKVVEVQPGPVITLYEFEPAPGVKVQKVISLADDLAMALKVASVRVYAPVPGKGTVGIEVPNSIREIVRLRDLVETPIYNDPQYQIALALGKDTFGDPFIADLAKMPHLLIAGATGTGKSVCINSLLLSLLYRNTPQDLRLIMIDPKMLELSVYEDIPHLKAPVVTQAKRAKGVLWWAVEEMEKRYSLMKELGVRNLASYNALVSSKQQELGVKTQKNKEIIELQEKDIVSAMSEQARLNRDVEEDEFKKINSYNKHLEQLPRIVIVVDELADLMLTVGREIEELLTRLAQKARAAGIHLILATQRPSVNVITGLIKANFPSRISFKVASRIDSRTVLDASGAEKLLGQGDLLFLSPGAGRPKRLHSPFVSDKEVHDVVQWLRSQGKPHYDKEIQQMIDRIEQGEQQAGEGPGATQEEYDPLYDQAVNIVIEKGLASTSMVQRVFRIGYNRAARILETMEKEGIVGPADGAKPRQVLLAGRDI